MSRYYSLLVITFLLVGCSYKAKSAPLQNSIAANSINSRFDKKDFYMIVALDSEYRRRSKVCTRGGEILCPLKKLQSVKTLYLSTFKKVSRKY